MNLSIVPVLRRPRSRVVHHHSKRRQRCQGGCTGVSAAGHKAAEQLPPGLGSTGTSSQKESRAEIMHALSSGGQDAWRFSGSAVYQLYAVVRHPTPQLPRNWTLQFSHHIVSSLYIGSRRIGGARRGC